MTSINSAATGNFADGATWVGGVAPGHGDTANVMSGHSVTVAAAIPAITRIAVYGELIINSDINITTSGGNIVVTSTGKVTNNGTPSAPRSITYGGAAGGQWYFEVQHASGTARRTIDLSNIIMSGNTWVLRGIAGTLGFNSLITPGLVMVRPAPITREVSINEHVIDGRSGGLVYLRGMAAGRCTVRGYVPYGNPQYWQMLEDDKSLSTRVSLTTDVVHMGSARIESLRWGEPKGNNIPFTMVLVEDL